MRNICGRWKVDADQVDEGLQTSSLKNIDHRNVELDIELLSIASEHETPVIILKFWRESELTTSTQFQFGRINSCNDSNEDVAFIRDADESFTSFKIIHYTATEIQEKEFKKVETFRLSEDDSLLYSFHGINLQFQRVNSEEVAINPIKLSDKILKASIGWNKANTWPAIVLANTQVKIIEVDHKVEEQITQIWSSSPLHQNQLKSQFSQELNISEKESGDLNLKFQLSNNEHSWQMGLSLSEIRILNNFMVMLNPPSEDEDSVITRLSQKSIWKTYLEFHKYVIHVDNTFRGYLQHADVIPQPCIEVVVESLQISSQLQKDDLIPLKTITGYDCVNEDFSWHDNKISVKVKTSVGSSPGDHHSDTDSPQTGSNRKSHTPGKRPSLSIKERNEFFHTNTNPIPRNNEDKDGALVGSPTDIGIVEVSKPVRSFNIPPPILINKSLDAGELNDIYMPSSSLKYMPVDLVGSSTVKQSIAKGLLLSVLARGIVVIKYGRQGKPKRKRLFCNPQVTALMWQSDAIEEGEGERETRFINISDIKDIRLGTDIDPITSDSALQSAYEHGEIQRSDMDMVKEARQREGINNIPTDKSFYARKTGGFLSSFFVSKEKDVVLYGTPTLRRSCKEEDMKMCISLILEDRTFDIQCLQQRDMDTLRINLNELIHIHDTKTLGGKSPSMYLAANDNPLKAQKVTPKKTTPKKSVRFSTDPDDSKRDNMTASQLPHLELGSLGSESTGLSRQGSAVMYWNEDEEDLDKLLDKTISPLNSPMASDGTVSPVPDHVSNREPTETNKPSLRMTSTEALQIGFILSEQEKLYGTNMYESLQAADEVEIAKYVAKGFTSEEAIMRIFEKKYVPSNRMKLAYMSRTASEMANLLNPSKTEEGILVKGDSSFDLVETLDVKHESPEAEEEEEAVPGPRSLNDAGRKSSFFPELNSSKDDSPFSASEPHVDAPENVIRVNRMSSAGALQIGLLLAQQEERYGTNMYESMQLEDEAEVKQLRGMGKSTEEAAMEIFKKKCDNGVILPHTTLLLSSGAKPSTNSGDDKDGNEATQPNEEHTLDFLSPFTPSPMRSGSSFFPSATSVLPNNTKLNPNPPSSTNPSVGDVQKEKTLRRMTSDEAMNLAMLLSEQETLYGINMYDSLTPQDEPTVQTLVRDGMQLEHAILTVFSTKYDKRPTNSVPAVSNPMVNQVPTAMSHPQYGAYPYYPGSYSPYHPYGYAAQPNPYPYGYGQATYSYDPYASSPGYSPYSPYSQPQYGYNYSYSASPAYYPPEVAQPAPHQSQAQASGQSIVATAVHLPESGTPQRRPSAQRSASISSTSSNTGSPAQRRPSTQRSSSISSPNASIQGSPVQQRRPSATRTASLRSSDSSKLQRSPSVFGMLFGSTSKQQGEIKCKESDVKAITKMGFSREQAIWALSENDHNVALAINILTR